MRSSHRRHNATSQRLDCRASPLIQYPALPNTVHGSLGRARRRSKPARSARQHRLRPEIRGRSTFGGIAERAKPIKSGMAEINRPNSMATESGCSRIQVPVSATVELMNQAKVDKMLISAWVAPRREMISNDEVAAFVAQAPDRLIGVGSADISQPMKAVREIRRCASELGFKAIRVLPWLWELAPTDRRFYPVYAACCELGIPFCTQIGHTGPLMPSEPGRPIYLDQVALDFPELTLNP